MTLRHIEIFATVCREGGSITRAANRLRISQPTVSVAIQEMEAHYGSKLFDRLSNRLYITPFGKSVYDQALRLLNIYDGMLETERSLNFIRMGTGTAIGKQLMPSIVRSFTNIHPDIRFRIFVSESTRAYHMVMENELDFVIAETVDDIPGLSHRVIQQYPIVGICHRDHPLAVKAEVTARDLAKENLLLRNSGSSTRYAVDSYFSRHSLNVIPMWESYSVQTLLNAAKEGIGVTFLSLDHILVTPIPELVILNIPDFQGMRYVNLCFHKDKFFTPQMEEFLQHFESRTQQMIEKGWKSYTESNPIPPNLLFYRNVLRKTGMEDD